MSLHLKRELDRIRANMEKMTTLVEETIEKASRSVMLRDEKLASEVLEGDHIIDELEIEIEEDCLKTLALHQPVAIDLRYLIAVLKINSDLERMGDLSYNIARTTRILAKGGEIELGFDFNGLLTSVKAMVKDSLTALFEKDAYLARKVIDADDRVDDIKSASGKWALKAILENPGNAEVYMRYLSCARNLERIGDLATNVAEDVIYLAEGKIVRHQMGGD